MVEEKRYLSLREFGERYDIPTGTAYHLSAADQIAGKMKIGRAVRIDVEEFEAAARNGHTKVEAA